ncbi:hypothetical protein BD311DRAFT_741589 [Dichomitus squalens]|uniref:Uncharacterized protein n=1 Tax=Dichomitus squalens TaxID=114155 RepID=A0A4Q9MC20_9APHY|nr:hypothetical protein BD311DRAFT_741589 [Dichomitus squalens]
MAAHFEAVAPRASGLPSILEMQSYLRDFTEIHRPSFQGLIHARMQSMGGTEKVLTEEPKVCLVPLKYRHPGSEGINPALTFTLSSLVFLPLQRVLSDAATNRPRFTEAWEASTASRAHAKALFSDDPGFVDILPILFAPHAGPTQFATSPKLPDSARSQIEMYSAFIELGIVMRPPGKDAPPVPGYMKRLNDGKKWEWRPLWKNWYVDPAWTTSSMKERIKLLKRKLAEAQRSS